MSMYGFECHCGESFKTNNRLIEHLADHGLQFIYKEDEDDLLDE